MREFFDPIFIPGDGSGITKAFKEMGIDIEWKPYSTPLFDMKDVKPIMLGDCSDYKFTIEVPK